MKNFTAQHLLSRLRSFIEVPIGGCAYLKVGDGYIFYLVTKQKYSQKPTMSSLESSLRAMRDLCVQHGVRELAMPRIGCGLDRLNWTEVSQLIQTLFQDDDIEITIYALWASFLVKRVFILKPDDRLTSIWTFHFNLEHLVNNKKRGPDKQCIFSPSKFGRAPNRMKESMTGGDVMTSERERGRQPK